MNTRNQPLGITELSRRLGRSDRQLRRLASEGKIPRLPDGRFDEAAVRAALDKRTGPHRTRPLREPAEVRTVSTPADAREAVSLVRQVLREEGRTPGNVLSFDDVRIAEGILKTRERALRMSVRSHELVDKARAEAATFQLGRNLRDALQRWPVQVAALLAAELDIDAHKLETALNASIKKLLVSLAAVDADGVLAHLDKPTRGAQ